MAEAVCPKSILKVWFCKEAQKSKGLESLSDTFFAVFGTFIRSDGFGTLTENDATGGADLVCYFFDLFLWDKMLILKEHAKQGTENT